MPARRHQRWEPTQNQKSSGNVSKGRFLSTFRGLLQPLQGTSMSLEVTIKFSSCNRAKNRSTLLLPITTQHFYLHVADVMYYVLSHATSGRGRPQHPPQLRSPLPLQCAHPQLSCTSILIVCSCDLLRKLALGLLELSSRSGS